MVCLLSTQKSTMRQPLQSILFVLRRKQIDNYFFNATCVVALTLTFSIACVDWGTCSFINFYDQYYCAPSLGLAFHTKADEWSFFETPTKILRFFMAIYNSMMLPFDSTGICYLVSILTWLNEICGIAEHKKTTTPTNWFCQYSRGTFAENVLLKATGALREKLNWMGRQFVRHREQMSLVLRHVFRRVVEMANSDQLVRPHISKNRETPNNNFLTEVACIIKRCKILNINWSGCNWWEAIKCCGDSK